MVTEHRRRIMIVEDDDALVELMKMRLEDEGFDIHIESRGHPALAYATEHQLDLVILDLRLPDLGGYEVAKRLRQLYHPWVLPLLILTAMDKPMDQLRGFAFGADAYLTKPYDPEELVRTISLLLGEALRS